MHKPNILNSVVEQPKNLSLNVTRAFAPAVTTAVYMIRPKNTTAG